VPALGYHFLVCYFGSMDDPTQIRHSTKSLSGIALV
jgi:hypothetical protein